VPYYPVYLDLAGRACAVIGGGPLADEKVRGLLAAGAIVRVVASDLTPGLAELAAAGRIVHLPRPFQPGDLDGTFLAFTAGEDPATVDAVFRQARDSKVLLNTVDDVPHCDFIMPSILRRGDLTVAISTAGKAPALAVRLRECLEGVVGPEHARFLELAGAVRAPLARRWPDFATRRELWYRLVDSDVLALLRQGDEAAALVRFEEILGVAPEPDLPEDEGGGASPLGGGGCGRGEVRRGVTSTKEALTGAAPTSVLPLLQPPPAQGEEAHRPLGQRSPEGIVYIVGAGPGDPDLLTIKALKTLRRADVVVYDRLVNPEILSEAPASAERIFAGKAPGAHSCAQEDINALLVSHAREGRVVVRLKGGDPFVFGRGGEEALACAAAGIPWEIVPGVTSAISVPGIAGIPVTHRGVAGAFAVVTGHCMDRDSLDWQALARIDTLVVLMGVARLPTIAAHLLRHGRPPDTPAAVIEKGTLPGERVVTGTLATISEEAARAEIGSPAILVIGEVVRVREGLGLGLGMPETWGASLPALAL
jgi:uroporphyrin-III C-methyltransferase/precorrin-2 dehydrogenase/sirohydrochlorin ferrochelatase